MEKEQGAGSLRIALYAGMYIENKDGATKTLYQLTQSILKKKFNLAVWAFALTPQKKKGLRLYKLWSIPFPCYRDYSVAFPWPRLREYLDAFSPDIIHVAAPDLVGIYLTRYARRKKIPLVISYHTDFPSYLESYRIECLKKTLWKYFQWFYNQANRVFVPTQEVESMLNRKNITRTKIWSRGIDLNKYDVNFRSQELRKKWGAEKKIAILYSGRFVWYKDLEVFIRVYRKFKKSGPHNVVFVLLGSGPIEADLKRAMPDAVFPGYLTGKDLSEAYASADIFLFPSTTETFGNVIQESLCSGVPAVVSNIGGCQEIVNNSQGGLVAEAKDTESFYRCCCRLIEDHKLYQTLRTNGLGHFQDRSWDKINDRVINEYIHLHNQA
jgi:phosphatidylinositol alpha 1,6-mannosyltransferase